MKKHIITLTAALLMMSAFGTDVHAASSWKSAYASLLRSELKKDGADDKGFSVYDLDGDDIPELIVSERYAKWTTLRIYRYKDGKLKALTMTDDSGKRSSEVYSSYGTISFSPEKQQIIDYHTGTGFMSNIYDLRGDEILYSGTFSSVGYPGSSWGDKEIGYDELYVKLWKEYPYGTVPLGSTFPLTEDMIKCAVTGCGSAEKTYALYVKSMSDAADKDLKEKADASRGEDRYFSRTHIFSGCHDLTGDGEPELIMNSAYTSYKNFDSYKSRSESADPDDAVTYMDTTTEIFTYKDGRMQLLYVNGSSYDAYGVLKASSPDILFDKDKKRLVLKYGRNYRAMGAPR
ncbi:MAG: hypothetical protein IKR73_01550, partial [Oscillospiraceae bacterium]|nr:hypothetical protein [Oscillospiraceae bacterium]